jgi:hypothetical protein
MKRKSPFKNKRQQACYRFYEYYRPTVVLAIQMINEEQREERLEKNKGIDWNHLQRLKYLHQRNEQRTNKNINMLIMKQ